MHFLFVYPSPGVLGGIETLIVRMSRWLTSHGHQVTLILDRPDKWAHLLPPEVRRIELGDRFRRLYFYYHARRLWKEFKIDFPDVIKSFDVSSSWIACQLATFAGTNCKVVAGLYNPLVFKHYYARESLAIWDRNRPHIDNFLENIPASARLFCGVDQLEELDQEHGQTGLLWPLPIDPREFEPGERAPQWGKIVSVGRLSPMKEYNLYMVEIVRSLIEKGHEVTWSVYGAGEYESQMLELIKKYRLGNSIIMKGSVPYALLRKVLQDAYIFVGMGTAILEASLFKVPNVIALAYDSTGITYGPVYRLPRGSIGQLSTCPPLLRVEDEIERILRLAEPEYEAEAKLVSEHVQDHEIDASMEKFVELSGQAAPFRAKKRLYLLNYPLWAVRQALNLMKRNGQPIRHPGAGKTP
jgi:hypothetical protein